MIMKTVTEKRFFEWHEDDVAVTLRNKGGSYGGGRKSSSFAIAIDFYNHKITGNKTMTLNACRMDIHKIPCVLTVNYGRGDDVGCT